MNPPAATSHDETPVWFEAGDESLFGIHTAAATPSRQIAVVVAAGGGTPLSTSVNDFSVRLCRRVSSLGFDGFRFDYHGVGESTGNVDRFHLAEPFVVDLEAAVSVLRDRGLSRFVLVGECFGARTALAAAPGIDGVESAILIAPPVRDFEMGHRLATRMAEQASWSEYLRRTLQMSTIRNLRDADHRRAYARLAKEKIRRALRSKLADSAEDTSRYKASPEFIEPLRQLVEGGVPTSLIFGDGDDLLADFENAHSGDLGRALSQAPGPFEVTVIEGEVHGFTTVDAQNRVLDLITKRLASVPPS